MAFKVNQRQSSESSEMMASQAGLAAGQPLLLTVDEIIDDKSIKATLIIAGLNTPEGTKVTVEQALASPDFRSLSQTIKGTDKIPPLRKGEVIGFNLAYINKGKAAVGTVSLRTHDNMRGNVQVMSCMARLSKASVSSKGATQFVTILDADKAMKAYSLTDVEKAWETVLDARWPGGEPGFIIRDNHSSVHEWFLKKGEKFSALLEELEYNQVFEEEKAVIELIPAWSLPAGREQITRDVDVRAETNGSKVGPVSKLFQFDEKRARNGFLACLAVVTEEEEFAFGGPTGKIIPVVAGLQPCFRKQATDPLYVPTNIRPYKSHPNGIRTLYTDEVLDLMRSERISRRGPDQEPSKPARSQSPRQGTSNRDYDEGNIAPKKPIFMGRR